MASARPPCSPARRLAAIKNASAVAYPARSNLALNSLLPCISDIQRMKRENPCRKKKGTGTTDTEPGWSFLATVAQSARICFLHIQGAGSAAMGASCKTGTHLGQDAPQKQNARAEEKAKRHASLSLRAPQLWNRPRVPSGSHCIRRLTDNNIRQTADGSEWF